MNNSIRRRLAPILLLFVMTGCSKSPSGPASVAETSVTRAKLEDRVRFVENYVTFRREYEELDYDVTYHNNSGGMVPGPSDWDIRLIAAVPATDLDAWVPNDVEKNEGPPPKWLLDLPGSIERDKITEWYRNSGIEVGVDRTRSLVAYRNTSMPD